ncbi:MAG: hypothetical protein IPJ87_02450 [Flavobacteriales bacterium]|jgi:hypothetical protein|nr:hypothetical protein [Flavobacteriales bacterium]MBK7940734.1 hypothetical protein [Flavobacteriales bacterium]MBK8949457.1 hypothetical protein [Flavobacteriales bacterium]MBK9700850.1 hypothetical protein [Flavobacteriales bacterium]
MRFVADECLDGRIVKRLITDGHDLVVIRSELTGPAISMCCVSPMSVMPC